MWKLVLGREGPTADAGARWRLSRSRANERDDNEAVRRRRSKPANGKLRCRRRWSGMHDRRGSTASRYLQQHIAVWSGRALCPLELDGGAIDGGWQRMKSTRRGCGVNWNSLVCRNCDHLRLAGAMASEDNEGEPCDEQRRYSRKDDKAPMGSRGRRRLWLRSLFGVAVGTHDRLRARCVVAPRRLVAEVRSEAGVICGGDRVVSAHKVI